MKKNIYIPIEILYRELSSRLHLSSLACLKGYRVYLGTKHGIDILLNQKIKKNIREGIFFYKSALFSNKKYIDKVDKSCEHFVVLDEELGPALKTPEFAINNRCVFDKRIKYFFVISKKIKNKILCFDKRFEKNIKDVGWPKFDVFDKKILHQYILQSKKIKKKFGSFYLFSSNFGVLSQKGLKDKLSKIKELKQLKNYNKKKFELQSNLNNFLKLKKDLKEYNSKKKLIIRPHPSEFYHEDWNSLSKLNQKIKIIYSGESLPWILASEGLIHRGCTTSLDAYLVNKPIFFWRCKGKLRNNEKNITYKISEKINSFKNIDEKKYQINKIKFKKILQNEIKNVETHDAVPSIIKELNKLITTPSKKIDIKNLDNFFLKFIKKKIKNFLIIIRLLKTKKNQKIPEDFNLIKIKKNLRRIFW